MMDSGSFNKSQEAPPPATVKLSKKKAIFQHEAESQQSTPSCGPSGRLNPTNKLVDDHMDMSYKLSRDMKYRAYKRKGSVGLREWSEQELLRAMKAVELLQAMQAVQQRTMGLREASRNFGVPYSTLRRRLKNNIAERLQQDPLSAVDPSDEKKVVTQS